MRWIHSKIKLFEQLVFMQDKNIEELENLKHDYMLKLDHMQLPFWWLEGENIKELAYSSNYTNTFIQRANEIGYGERKTSVKIDRFIKRFNETGVLPWTSIGIVLSYIYFAVLAGVCLLRTDFYNIACCIASLYMFSNPIEVKKWMIRLLFYATLISYVYDGLWMFAHFIPWWGKMKYDGDVEMKLRKIVIILSFVSMFVRAILGFVIWKVSVDYAHILKSEEDIYRSEIME